MPKQPGQRPKLLLLMHILYQQTDEMTVSVSPS